MLTNKLKVIITSLFALSFILCFSGCKENEDTKPNIVFIFIDDMGWTDLGYMGSEYYETPAIDKLASQGIVFTSAYSNAANCAPTRASLLTGQYPPRHNVYTVGTGARGNSKDRRLIPVENSKEISFDKISIAESLKKAGYASAAIGKWNVGNKPEDHGFDYGIDRYDMGIQGHFDKKNGDYLTDILTDKAIEFIKENNPHETGKPFFVYLAHHAVHTPIQAKDELIEEFNEKDPSGCHDNATYAAMIKSIDESVDRINKTLIELNLSKNTMLIFFSDNGGHGTFTCQKPLRGGKGMFYEGGIRVPMFVSWPGNIKPGSTCDEPVIGTDFYPTFLKLAGLSSPENYPLDGQNILPLIKGERMPQREPLFFHFPGYLQSYQGLKNESRDTIFRTRPVSLIRKGDWKLLLFYEEWILDGGEPLLDINNSVELYNLKEDIGEQNNLVKSNPEKRDELLNELLQWQKDIQAPIPSEPNPEYQDIIVLK